MAGTEPNFGAFLNSLVATWATRNQAYGTRNITGPAGVLERARDKLARLQNAIDSGGQGELNDWIDLAGYAGVGWLLATGQWDDRSAVRRVYFAHPAGPEIREHEATLDLVHTALRAHYAVFRPVGAFQGGVQGQADWVWLTNLANIEASDMLVAYLPYPSNGVAAEMLYAKGKGKTVWALVPPALAQSSLVQYTSSRVFTDARQMVDALRRLKEVRSSALPADQEA